MKALAELRDWLSFALGLLGGYAALKELRRNSSKDVIIWLPAAVAGASM